MEMFHRKYELRSLSREKHIPIKIVQQIVFATTELLTQYFLIMEIFNKDHVFRSLSSKKHFLLNTRIFFCNNKKYLTEFIIEIIII